MLAYSVAAIKPYEPLQHGVEMTAIERNTAAPNEGFPCRTVTVVQAARILGIGRSSAYEAVRSHQIPGIKIGSRWVVPVEALEKMLADAAS